MTDDAKKTLYVFPKDPNGPEAGGCGCGSSCEAGTDGGSLEDVLKDFAEQYGDRIELKTASYATGADCDTAIEDLNAIMIKGEAPLRADKVNLAAILSQVGPVFAIEDRIICARMVPTVEQLGQAALTGVPIPYSGCC